jgi:hypothetical protein
MDAAIEADSDELEKGRNELQVELDEQREMYEDKGWDTSFLDEQQARIDKMDTGSGEGGGGEYVPLEYVPLQDPNAEHLPGFTQAHVDSGVKDLKEYLDRRDEGDTFESAEDVQDYMTSMYGVPGTEEYSPEQAQILFEALPDDYKTEAGAGEGGETSAEILARLEADPYGTGSKETLPDGTKVLGDGQYELPDGEITDTVGLYEHLGQPLSADMKEMLREQNMQADTGAGEGGEDKLVMLEDSLGQTHNIQTLYDELDGTYVAEFRGGPHERMADGSMRQPLAGTASGATPEEAAQNVLDQMAGSYGVGEAGAGDGLPKEGQEWLDHQYHEDMDMIGDMEAEGEVSAEEAAGLRNDAKDRMDERDAEQAETPTGEGDIHVADYTEAMEVADTPKNFDNEVGNLALWATDELGGEFDSKQDLRNELETYLHYEQIDNPDDVLTDAHIDAVWDKLQGGGDYPPRDHRDSLTDEFGVPHDVLDAMGSEEYEQAHNEKINRFLIDEVYKYPDTNAFNEDIQHKIDEWMSGEMNYDDRETFLENITEDVNWDTVKNKLGYKTEAGAGEGVSTTGSGSRDEAFNLYKEDYGDDASEEDFNEAYQGHWEVEKDSEGREIPVEWAKDWVEQIGGVSEAISQEQIQFNTDYDKWNAELDNYGEGYGAEQNLDTGKWEVYDRQDADMPPTEYEYQFEAEDAAKEMNNDLLDEMIASGGNQPSDGENYAEKYFDFHSWARDLVMGGEISVENGHVFWNR